MPKQQHVRRPPCGGPVHANRGTTLLGFCTRYEGHKGSCSHMVDDRTVLETIPTNNTTRIQDAPAPLAWSVDTE